MWRKNKRGNKAQICDRNRLFAIHMSKTIEKKKVEASVKLIHSQVLQDIKDKIGNENSECRLAVMQKRTSIVYSLLKVI